MIRTLFLSAILLSLSAQAKDSKADQRGSWLSATDEKVASSWVSQVPIFKLSDRAKILRIYIGDSEDFMVEIDEKGDVRGDWSRIMAASEKCYSDEGSDIGWQACAVARSMVAAAHGQVKEMHK